MNRNFGLGAGAALAIAALGCSKTTQTGAACITQMVSSCVCDDGRIGIQTCQSDNTFGLCSCGQAGAPSGGTSGGAGNLPSGSGGTPSATGGVTGGGGVTGSGGTSGVTGGGTGGDLSSGGAGGDLTGGGGASGTGTGGGEQPTGGAPFAYCMSNAQCMSGSSCATARANGSVTGYCAPGCALAACPAPPSGGVTVSCLAGLCLLGSCQNAQCPTGMSCVMQSRRGQTTSYNCEYPPQ